MTTALAGPWKVDVASKVLRATWTDVGDVLHTLTEGISKKFVEFYEFGLNVHSDDISPELWESPKWRTQYVMSCHLDDDEGKPFSIPFASGVFQAASTSKERPGDAFNASWSARLAPESTFSCNLTFYPEEKVARNLLDHPVSWLRELVLSTAHDAEAEYSVLCANSTKRVLRKIKADPRIGQFLYVARPISQVPPAFAVNEAHHGSLISVKDVARSVTDAESMTNDWMALNEIIRQIPDEWPSLAS